MRAACIKILLLLGSFSFSFPCPNAGPVTRHCRWPNHHPAAFLLFACSCCSPRWSLALCEDLLSGGCGLLLQRRAARGAPTATFWLARCSSHCSRCPSLHGMHGSDQQSLDVSQERVFSHLNLFYSCCCCEAASRRLDEICVAS